MQVLLFVFFSGAVKAHPFGKHKTKHELNQFIGPYLIGARDRKDPDETGDPRVTVGNKPRRHGIF
jgi:hypothetical protein